MSKESSHDFCLECRFVRSISSGQTQGTSEFTGKVINCIGAGKGASMSVDGTDTLTRSVRGSGLGIGVQAGDSFTVGLRLIVTDAS